MGTFWAVDLRLRPFGEKEMERLRTLPIFLAGTGDKEVRVCWEGSLPLALARAWRRFLINANSSKVVPVTFEPDGRLSKDPSMEESSALQPHTWLVVWQ